MIRLMAAVFSMVALTGCGDDPIYASPKFSKGDMVRTKIGGYAGMVIGQSCPRINGPYGNPDARCTYTAIVYLTEV